MARLSQKISKNLNDLPINWQTKEELLAALIDDPLIVDEWRLADSSMMLPLSVDGISRLFFMKNSWQLTSWGMIAFARTFKSWNIEHEDNALTTGRSLVGMGRIMDSPWHIRGRHLYVWDQDRHFEIQLLDGSVRRFVDFYLPK